MGNKSSITISPEDLSKLSTQTHFDEEEIRISYNGFVKDHPDGKLNKRQFIDLYSSFYKSGKARKFAKHVFRTFDINSDESVDFREFICSLSVTTRGSVDEKLFWAFNLYDINGNGYITKEGISTIMTSIQKIIGADQKDWSSETNVLQVFDKMDLNKDGKLSLDEFMKGAQKDKTFLRILQTCMPKKNI